MTEPELIVVDVAVPTTVTPVFVPGGGVDLGPVITRVDALEAADSAHEIRLGVLEATTGGGADAVQELIDIAVAGHAQAAAPHTAYDDLPSFRLIYENGLI